MSLYWSTQSGLTRIALFGFMSVLFMSLTGIIFGNATTSERSVAIAQVLSALGSVLIVFLTTTIIRNNEVQIAETRAARLAQSRPQVAVSFYVGSDGTEDGELNLRIGHYGGGIANNVRFSFAPPLLNEDGVDIGANPPFSTGIALVPPGFRQKVEFGSFIGFREAWFLSVRPGGVQNVASRFAVTTILNDPLADNIEYTHTYVIDTDHLMGYNQTHYQVVPIEVIAAELQNENYRGE